MIASSIRRFGFRNPVLIDADEMIIAGHGRVMAAKELGLTEVPVIRIDDMSEADLRAYAVADNQIATSRVGTATSWLSSCSTSS
jgi:ParB-like chromosome segregation protein Spo0J